MIYTYRFDVFYSNGGVSLIDPYDWFTDITEYFIVPPVGKFWNIWIKLHKVDHPMTSNTGKNEPCSYCTWWRHQIETFPRYWPFVRGIHYFPVNSSHKGQWRGALMFSWICVWINGWVNNREAGDLRRYRAHYGVTVMTSCIYLFNWLETITLKTKYCKTCTFIYVFMAWQYLYKVMCVELRQ